MNGTLVAEDTTCCTWDEPWNSRTIPDGSHTIVARASDSAGNLGSSARVSFSVDNAPAVRASPSSIRAPNAGAYFGAYVSSRWGTFAGFEEMIGRRMQIDLHYYDWGSRFPGREERDDVANGRIPMLTWEPWHASGCCPAPTLGEIASGAHDDVIRERARAVRGFRHPVFFRFAHEMNGDWYPWGGYENARNPSLYVKAYRRVFEIFRDEGAANAAFVWSPNWESVPKEGWNNFRNYYPGDAYVHWVAVDAYNRFLSRWTSLSTLVEPVYRAFPDKPFMLAETGTIEDPNVPGRKADWIREAHADLKTVMPNVKAFVWFHRPPSDSEPIDWRVDTSPSALEAFRAMAADPYFRPETLGGPPPGG